MFSIIRGLILVIIRDFVINLQLSSVATTNSSDLGPAPFDE